MREYRYKALAKSGETVSGIRNAADVAALTQALFAQDLILIESKSTLGSLGKSFSFAGRAGRRELRDFTLNISTSLAAGIPILSALRDFEAETRSGAFRDIIADIRNDISGGTQVAEALAKHPEVFSEIYVAMVTAGQDTGNLAETFGELVAYLEWFDDLQGKTKQAMVYPAVLLAGVMGLFVLLMLYVLPRFMGLFEGMDFELPGLTKAVISVWEGFGRWWPFMLGGGIAAVVGFKLFHRTEQGHYLTDLALLRIPVVGGFMHKLSLSRFARHFSLLFSSGTDLLRLLELLQRVVGNEVLAKDLAMIHQRVTSGETLAASFAESRNFPPLIQRLIAVGEKTGQLDTSLAKAADFLDKEIPRALKQAFTLFEAIIIALLGGLIAVSALSILLPIFQMRSNLG